VKFPWPHFHIDWRFAPTWLFRRCVSKWTRGGTLLTTGAYYATPIMCPNNFGERVIFEGPVLRRMKCKRELDPYPREHAKWLEGLAKDLHTRGCGRLINGTCPHRGIPVDAMHRDGDVLTCPAHGLRFSASTGEMLDGSSPEALR
jgi:Rieske Fe-S protein